MGSEAEKFKLEHAGMVARSAQGHAAKGMKIKDQEDMWVSIQHNTFRNWVNVQLRDTGLKVDDLSEDLRDGVALVTLVESLQKRKLRKVRNVTNQHQALENVTSALNAIAEDGIKLVNIGNVDIVNGNLKLILGLIWSLIMHYQIGQTQVPPKKLMLSWLKGALPNCDINNFTSDWNSGVNLSALVNYCDPKLLRNWKTMNPKDSVNNCKRAMEVARKEFNIPLVLEPEYLASPYLDDLSGMTYLSYFMKEGGPGYKATLDWIRKTLPENNIKNFTTDWNDGYNLANLVKKFGGSIPGYKNMNKDQYKWEQNLQAGLDQGRKLGIEPVLSAADMARPDVEYLGPMAYLSYFQWLPPKKSPADSICLKCDIENVRMGNPVPFRLDFLTKDVSSEGLDVSVNGPRGPERVEMDSGLRGAKGKFTPDTVGFYEIEAMVNNEHVEGSPYRVRVLPDVSKILFSGIDPCALGSIVEVLINSNGAGGGEIEVGATGPSRRTHRCPVSENDGVYTATFQPDEAGEWQIGVSYDDEDIQGSPFTCHVYDPNAIKIYGLEKGPFSKPGSQFTLVLDALECGWGDAQAEVTLGGVSQPSHCLEVERSLYELTFTPYVVGRYKVYVYFNGHEVKGSPFHLFLGMEKPLEKSKKKKSSKNIKDGEQVVKEYTSTVDSPMNFNNNSLSRNTFSKTFDSSTNRSFYNSLHKSYESNLNEINTSSRDYYSSLTRNRTIDNYNKSYDNILSKDYSKTLEKFRDPTRTLEFDFPTTRATFDIPINDKTNSIYTSSSLKRNSSGLRNSVLNDHNHLHTPYTSLNNTFNSTTSSNVVDTGYSSLKRTSHHHKSFERHTRTNSSSNQSNYLSDGMRSPKSPKGRSPMASPRSSPFRQTSPPRSIPVKQMSPPRNTNSRQMSPPPRSSPVRQMASPRSSPLRQMSPSSREGSPVLSSPNQVLSAAHNKPRTTEGKSLYYSSMTNMKILPSTY